MRRHSVAIISSILILLYILYIGAIAVPVLSESMIMESPLFILYEYQLSEEYGLPISLNSSATFQYRAPPPPKGFSLDYMEISIPVSILSSLKISCKGGIIKQRITTEVLTYRIYNSPEFVLSNIGSDWVNVTITVKVHYVDKTWIPVKDMHAKVSVPSPPIPFESKNASLTLEIPAFMPLRFKAIYDPNGRNILSSKVQAELSPDEIVISPRTVTLRFDNLPFGTYSIDFEKAEPMPCSVLYRNGETLRYEIDPGRTQIIPISAPPEGWRFSHAEVIIATVSLVNSQASGNITVEAPLLDEVANIENVIMVRFVRAKYMLRALVVYSDRFKITNGLKVPVIVYVIPFMYKAVGDWSPMGLSVSVGNNDLEGATYAFLEVMTYGAPIEKVVIPGNREVTSYYDTQIPWISNLLVSCEPDHVLIQLADNNSTLSGSFSFAIRWQSISFSVTDANGEPLQSGKLVLLADGQVMATSDISYGEAVVTPYKPALYEAEVIYHGVKVFNGFLSIPLAKHYDLKAKVYNMKIRVVGKRGQSLMGAVINVTGFDSNITLSAIADENGSAVFRQLPAGTYVIKATYKGVSTTKQVTLNENVDLELKLDVFFDVIGVAFKMNQTIVAIAILATVLLTIGILLKRRNGSSSIVLS